MLETFLSSTPFPYAPSRKTPFCSPGETFTRGGLRMRKKPFPVETFASKAQKSWYGVPIYFMPVSQRFFGPYLALFLTRTLSVGPLGLSWTGRYVVPPQAHPIPVSSPSMILPKPSFLFECSIHCSNIIYCLASRWHKRERFRRRLCFAGIFYLRRSASSTPVCVRYFTSLLRSLRPSRRLRSPENRCSYCRHFRRILLRSRGYLHLGRLPGCTSLRT